MYYDKNLYSFSHFEVSKKKDKKYNAVLVNNKTRRIVRVPFGDKNYEQYKDRAMGVYSNQNHYDLKRRRLYHIRHTKDIKNGFWSAGLFSMDYLW